MTAYMYHQDRGFDLWQQLGIWIDVQPRRPPLPVGVQNSHSCANTTYIPFVVQADVLASLPSG